MKLVQSFDRRLGDTNTAFTSARSIASKSSPVWTSTRVVAASALARSGSMSEIAMKPTEGLGGEPRPQGADTPRADDCDAPFLTLLILLHLDSLGCEL